VPFPAHVSRKRKTPARSRLAAIAVAAAALSLGTAGFTPAALASAGPRPPLNQSVGPLNYATNNNDLVFMEFYRLAGDGTPLHVYQNVGTANQEWNDTDFQADGDYEIQNNYPENLCIDIPNDNKGNGVQVQGWSCLGDPQQFWIDLDDSDGIHFMLSNSGTNTCLNDWNGSTANEAPVKTFSCSFAIGNDLWQF
jgi:hypothetical protein